MAHAVGADMLEVWRQLPPKLQRKLEEAGLGTDNLAAWKKLCKDEDDLWSFVAEMTLDLPECDFNGVFNAFILLIDGGSEWVHKRRRLAAAMADCEQTARTRAAEAPAERAPNADDEQPRPTPPLRATVWLTKRQKQMALAENAHQRAAIETEERNKWARALATELLAGRFPIVETLAETTDAERALARQSYG